MALSTQLEQVLSLSETFSKYLEKPNNLKKWLPLQSEWKRQWIQPTLLVLHDFYDNAIDFGVQMISPIASNAFIL
jgi:hypothetical protein